MSRNFPGTDGNGFLVGDVSAVDITGTALTFSAWVFLDRNNAVNVFVNKGTATATDRQFMFFTDASGKIGLIIGDSAGIDQVTGSTTVSTGVWLHVAGRKNGTGAGALQVFLNGTSDGSTTSNKSIQNTAHDFLIGYRASPAANCDARMSQIAVWNFAVSDSEIMALAKGINPHSIRRNNLKGYWPLFGTGSPEPDHSGNKNNATMTGTVSAGTVEPPASLFVFPSPISPSLVTLIVSDTISNTQTSSQSLTQSEAGEEGSSGSGSQSILTGIGETLSNSQTSSQSLQEFVGVLITETITNSQTAIHSIVEGRIPIPVTELAFNGIPQGTQVQSDADSKHSLENIQEDVVLEVISTDVSPQTVTIETSYAQDGAALDDRIVTIPAGATRYIGKFPRYIYNQEDLVTVYINPSVSGTLKFRAYKA